MGGILGEVGVNTFLRNISQQHCGSYFMVIRILVLFQFGLTDIIKTAAQIPGLTKQKTISPDSETKKSLGK